MVVNSSYQTVVPNVSGRSFTITHIEIFPGQLHYIQSICSPDPGSDWLTEQASLAAENARYLHNAVVLERCIEAGTCPSEVPIEIFERMLNLFDNTFSLEVGSYTLMVRTITNSGDSYLSTSTVSIESFHVEELRRIANFYRTGGGNAFGVDISPEPLPVLAISSD